MLQTHLHRRGQIPTSTHPFVKKEQETARLMQTETEVFWFHRLVSTCLLISIAMLKFLQHQCRRHT